MTDAILSIVNDYNRFKMASFELMNSNYFKSFNKLIMLDNYLKYISDEIS